MRALKRKDDVIVEDSKIRSIDWSTGQPLINPEWCGGPYILIEDYIPPAEDSDEPLVTDHDAERNAEIAELKARLAALENDL